MYTKQQIHYEYDLLFFWSNITCSISEACQMSTMGTFVMFMLHGSGCTHQQHGQMSKKIHWNGKHAVNTFYHSTATTHEILSSFISRIFPCVTFTPLLCSYIDICYATFVYIVVLIVTRYLSQPNPLTTPAANKSIQNHAA